MASKKESFFWTSYSDLMTSLFFVMLVLFVLVIVVQRVGAKATERQVEEIKKIEKSTKNLNTDYFEYRPDYKKYVLKIQVRYPKDKFDINDIVAVDKELLLSRLSLAGKEIQSFLKKYSDYQYLLIVEGQASRDDYDYNYELSYQRALGLVKFWIGDVGLEFGDNCEILISGSGDGRLNTHSMREPVEVDNQRFLIHLIPKNIIEEYQ